jgi:molybdate transport system substrate-binding protein
MGSKACVDATTAKESSKAQIGKPGRNTMDKFAIAAAIGLAMALAPARAAELKVIAGGSTASLKEIGPQFEKATDHKLDITFAATPELIKMATSGPFDLGVVPVDVMKNDGARAKFAGTPETIARVGYGVAVKAGAPKPDVSTPEALKAALLKAQSIAVFPASAAGAYVQKAFERLGIAEQIKDKSKVQTAAGAVPQAVANGDAELGVFLTNVLLAPGVELAGPFPGELQQELVFVGAVAADSKDAAAAKAFLDYLRTPDAVGVFKARGVTPG